MTALIDKYSGFIVDVDGVLHKHGIPIPGVQNVLDRLAEKQTILYTNDCRYSQETFARNLAEMGIRLPPSIHVYTSGIAAIDYLAHNAKSIHAIVDAELQDMLDQVPLNPTGLDYILLGILSQEYSEADFDRIVEHIRNGATVLVTAPDSFDPTEPKYRDNPSRNKILYMPWQLIQRLREHVEFEYIALGKPEPGNLLAKFHNLDPSQIVVIGDRQETDMKLAKSLGVDGIFVLSGGSTHRTRTSRFVEAHYMLMDITEILFRNVSMSEPCLLKHFQFNKNT